MEAICTRLLVTGCTLALLAVPPGCSASSSEDGFAPSAGNAGTAGHGTGKGGSGGSASTGGASGQGGSSAGTAGAPQTQQTIDLYATNMSNLDSAGTPVFEYTAGVWTVQKSLRPTHDCKITNYGSCRYFECKPDDGDGGTTTEWCPNTGTMTVSGGTETATTVVDQYNCELTTQPRLLWNGGETLEVSTVGGDVPALNGQVVAPTLITVTQPADVEPGVGSGWHAIVDRTVPLQLAWSGGGAGKVNAWILPGSFTTYLACEYDASAGAGEIPVEALQLFVDPNVILTLDVWAENTTHWVVQDASVAFHAMYFAVSPEGKSVTGQIE